VALCGVRGIVDAFEGNRKSALRRGVIAGLFSGLFLVIPLTIDVLFSPPREDGVEYAILFCLSLLPTAAAFWAVVLAFLIPEKSCQPKEPEQVNGQPLPEED
jgi:hypothetical protein